jgi:N-acetylglucosaminyl-diphospho-decaprenol L-rhamnosyltransferase
MDQLLTSPDPSLASRDATTWSLITVTFNSEDALQTFWSRPPEGVEWIVVDNASSDQTVSVAEDLGATVIRLSKNIGFGSANNIGLSRSGGEHIAFVNPDVSVDYASLADLNKAVADGTRLVSPQLLNPDGSLQPNGRGFPLIINKLRNRGSGATTLQNNYLLYANPGEVRAVCWFIGAAVAGNRRAFERLNAWDPRFFIYYEDSDICLRAWKIGISCQVTGDVRWTHGWARETTSFKWAPWKRELASMVKFYTRYPAMVLGNRSARRQFPAVAIAMERDGWTG